MQHEHLTLEHGWTFEIYCCRVLCMNKIHRTVEVQRMWWLLLNLTEILLTSTDD